MHRTPHQAVMSIITVIASRAMIPFETASQFLFQLYATQLVTGKAECLTQGRAFEV